MTTLVSISDRAKSEADSLHGMFCKALTTASLTPSLWDKCYAGTMDVLFVDQRDPWAPSPEICSRVSNMLSETHR